MRRATKSTYFRSPPLLPFSLFHSFSTMSDIDYPLCAASNSDTIYLAAYTPRNSNNSGRPPILSLYSSQQYPASLSSIKWKTEAASYFNHWMFSEQSLPEDSKGYWCAVDDTGTFAIFSGTKDTTSSPGPMPPATGTILGLIYDKPSKPTNPTFGGLAAPAYTPVSLNGTYLCIESGSCNAHLYALSNAATGAPSNFGFVTYNSTSGFSFEMLDRTSNKFTGQVGPGIPPVRRQLTAIYIVEGVTSISEFMMLLHCPLTRLLVSCKCPTH